MSHNEDPGVSPERRAAILRDAITSRRAVRGFLPDPVPETVVGELLLQAGRAPSGSNIQPWFADVLTGAALTRLTARILARYDAGDPPGPGYPYYPDPWCEPYLARRRRLGGALYGHVGIARGDTAAMAAQHRRNFHFFDAPVGLFFSLERKMTRGSWLDMGMFLQGFMIAARGAGLHTCPIQAFAVWESEIRAEIGLPEDRILVCGMALGHEDPAEPANALRPERMALDDFARFHR